jgi:hypothetical protein
MIRKGQRRIPDEDRKKHQIAVRITDEELSSLESIAIKKDLPVSFFIREGINMVIQKYKK